MNITLIALVLVTFLGLGKAQTDSIPPTIQCVQVDSIWLDDTTSFLRARDLVEGVSDDQSAVEDIRLAFSVNPLDTLFEVDCHSTKRQLIRLVAIDEAGNYDYCFVDTRLLHPDCQDEGGDYHLPTPICASSLHLSVNQEEVRVPARLIDGGSFDSDNSDPLRFSYSLDVSDTLRTWSCAQDISSTAIELYVTDARGRSDFCSTIIDIQSDGCYEPDTASTDSLPPVMLLRSISGVVLPPSGFICLYVEDFVEEVWDDQTVAEDIQLSFDPVEEVTAYALTCGDFEGDFSYAGLITIYATDLLGNQTALTVNINANDFGDADCADFYPDEEAPVVDCPEDTISLFVLPEDSLNAYEVEVMDNRVPFESLIFHGGHPCNSIALPSFDFSCADTGVVLEHSFIAMDRAGNETPCSFSYIVLDTLDLCGLSSVGEVEEGPSELRLYPNPTDDRLHLDYPDELRGTVHWQVYDAQGRMVFSHARENRWTHLDVHTLTPGYYVIQLQSSNGLYQGRFLRME